MNYFHGCKTPQEIKKRYRKLAMEHHPDHGGDTATMQEINAQYHDALAGKSGNTYTGTTGKAYTYTYDRAKENQVIATLAVLLAIGMQKVKIELIGTWIWVSGNTYPYKGLLKSAGLKWSGKRKMWYYTTQRGKKRVYYRRKSMDELRTKYGARVAQSA